MTRDHLRNIGTQADDYRRYDQYADVVACWEYLATHVTAIKSDVVDFHRFPKVPHSRKTGARHLTPDFVWEGSDSALLGEICTVPAKGEGVKSAVDQVANYMLATTRLDPDGNAVGLGSVETVVLTPHSSTSTTEAALLSTPTLRDLAAEHNVRPPVVVSFSADRGEYTFVKSAHPQNGEPDLFPGLARALDKVTVRLGPNKFTHFKVSGPFINDPIPPLYLASYLLARGMVGRGKAVKVADVVAPLQERYGRGASSDVSNALDLLVAAEVLRCAGNTYEHRRALPQRQEVHDALIARMNDVAEKATKREEAAKARAAKKTSEVQGQDVLF